ncbi:cyclic di-GMP regulator CdgR [Anopheles sinensis]|uniref:Cyclic di-GMP regulator CdgR n=1 Tax=Anopheles sinensis TaxID=74873 RepID=A0A084WMD7_ANOSI|nr:cyclic di-GMP regulator CdgR [Anopheles sinensis]
MSTGPVGKLRPSVNFLIGRREKNGKIPHQTDGGLFPVEPTFQPNEERPQVVPIAFGGAAWFGGRPRVCIMLCVIAGPMIFNFRAEVYARNNLLENNTWPPMVP